MNIPSMNGAGVSGAGVTGAGGGRSAHQRSDHALAAASLEPPAPPAAPAMGPEVHVDCEGCTVRPQACGDCVVTFLLGSPPEGVDLAPDEQEALDVLAASGLVPALRYRPIQVGPAPSPHEA